MVEVIVASPNKDPNKPLEPAVQEFIKYILSKDGQAETTKAGVYPLINSTRMAGLKHIGMAETP
jgi:ABC-type glycerol-3-phosphate transport system substrate-binding protein